MKLRNTLNRKSLLIVTLAVLGLFTAWLTTTHDLLAQEEHDEHDDEKVVQLSDAEIKEFDIKVGTAGPGKLPSYVSLPGEVVVNADRIAHVTPRASGVVREVFSTLGDHVRAGEMMAILDSPQMGEAQIAYLNAKTEVNVAQAKLELAAIKLDVAKAQRDVAKTQVEVARTNYDLAVTNVATAKMTLEVRGAETNIAKTDFEWQQTIHDNTNQLLVRLAEKATTDEIAQAFKGKPIGENRGRLLKGYAGLHFAQAAYEREKTLREKQISSELDFLEAEKEYTSAKAEFEAITEELGFQNRLSLMEKRRAVEAAARDVKEAEQFVSVAEGTVRAAESAIRVAEGSLQSAEMEVKATEQDLNVAQQNQKLSRSALRAAEGKLHILGLTDDEIAGLRDNNQGAHADVTRYVMRAPFEGVVIEKHIVLGEALGGDAQAFVVADLRTVWVDISVYQKDLPVVRKKQSVIIAAGHGIPEVKGDISWISPRVDEHTRTALARVVLPNTEGHWRPGIFITAKIAVSEVLVPLLVPKTALQTVEEKLSVFVQDEDGFEPREVTLGRSNDTHVEITSGLAPGQRYVMAGAFTLKAQLSKGAFGEGHAH